MHQAPDLEDQTQGIEVLGELRVLAAQILFVDLGCAQVKVCVRVGSGWKG
jgi:hypothetical protein